MWTPRQLSGSHPSLLEPWLESPPSTVRLSHYRIQLPHRTVFRRKSFKQHTFAPNRQYEIRTKIMLQRIPAFNRNAVSSFSPAVFCPQAEDPANPQTRHFQPDDASSTSVLHLRLHPNTPRACYCNVMGIAGINQRIIIAGRCLPMRKHQRIMLFRLFTYPQTESRVSGLSGGSELRPVIMLSDVAGTQFFRLPPH